MAKRIPKIAGRTVAWVEHSLEELLRRAASFQHQAIARRAHQLFLERDGAHGHDLHDWLEAKRQLFDYGEPES
jgi:hypothetical protein